MKIKNYMLATGIAFGLIATNVNANILVQSQAFKLQDMCSSISGSWEGTGTISAKIARQTIKCEYKGRGLASTGFGTQTFTIQTNLDLLSGLCPKSAEFTLPGTCDGDSGKIVLKSDEADLTGVLINNGTSVNLTGTVSVKVTGMTIKATVERMEIHKI